MPLKIPRRAPSVAALSMGSCLIALIVALVPLSAHAGGAERILASAESPAGTPAVRAPEGALERALAHVRTEGIDKIRIREAISLLEHLAPKFPDDIRIPLYLAEAWYRLADPERDVDKEFPVYEKAGAYAREVLERDPGCVEALYWRGLVLLKTAEKAGPFRAYGFVRNGVRELQRVRRKMPAYDHGGASRVLALLYYTAPGWTPFGDIDRSVALAEEAVRIAPDYPPNHLYLANAYRRQGGREAAIREYRTLLAMSSGPQGVPWAGIREQAGRALRTLGAPEAGSP